MALTPKVEYHHEFLYFNAFVREKGCTPKKHPDIWFTPENKQGKELSLYEICNILLFNMKATSRKAKPWLELVKTMLHAPHFPPELLEKVDVKAWLEYARSLDIEGKLDRYLPKIFNAFGNTFEVPVIKVSPVRLNPCPINHFRAIASGSYDRYNITSCDPAFYNKAGPVIYFPIPETAAAARMPEGTHDMVLMHEVVHASIRPFYGGLSLNEGELLDIPENVLNRAFSEVFSTLGATYAVYGEVYGPKKKRMPKSKLLNVSQHLLNDELFMQAFICMAQVGFENICRIVSPALSLTSRVTFLTRELNRIDTLTEKQMRGILTKRYAYKKQVSGMSKKVLKNKLLKHGIQRLRAHFEDIRRLQIHRLFAGAASGSEFAGWQQKVLLKLSDLFGPEKTVTWIDTGLTRGHTNP